MQPDITLALLENTLPAGTLSETNDDVLISVRALLGEPSIQMNSQVGTAINAKIFNASHQAQLAFNANPANSVDITSFSQPFTGTIQTVNNKVVVPMTLSLQYLAPVELDRAIPVTV